LKIFSWLIFWATTQKWAKGSELPQVVKDCVNIISFLAFQCGNVIWHDRELETRTKELVEKAMAQAEMVASSYNQPKEG
jgi:hypothetical protein